jgi:hypothetical protein
MNCRRAGALPCGSLLVTMAFAPPRADAASCDSLAALQGGAGGLRRAGRCHRRSPRSATLRFRSEDAALSWRRRACGCLTSAQVEAVRKIYAPARNPRTGQEIYPGMPPGGELGWAGLAGGPGPTRRALKVFKYFVFEDPNWDWRTFDFDRDVARTDAKIGSVLAAMNPHLRGFKARGGSSSCITVGTTRAWRPGTA